MIKKRIFTPLVLLFSSLSMLTGCDDGRIYDRTGKWGYKDLIYFENNGTKEKRMSPTGWIKLKDGEHTTFKVSKQPGVKMDFLYYDEENNVKGERFMYAYVQLWFFGNLKMEIGKDYTDTYPSGTKFILEKIE